MNKRFKSLSVLIVVLFLVVSNVYSQQYILIGWNDLGMHCSNKDFSKMTVLPPYNNINAQLILKSVGQSPQIITTGFKIEYSIPYNTYSVGKTNFWTYAQQVFGLPNPLPDNIGLAGKGLTGQLDIVTAGNYFHAEGIPVTPFKDTNWTVEKPFQTIHLVARNIATNDIVATTDVVIPVSNEIGCVQSGCHSSEQSIKNDHEDVTGFNTNGPELCARCHGSNALGTIGDTIHAKSFSYRIHEKHDNIQPVNDINTCYKCHPGPNTQCFRDVMRVGIPNPMTCQSCHGTMSQIASSINGGRKPWLQEPQCGNSACHGSNYAEEPNKLFRNSKGHGNIFCSACHGSPHAITPTREANDNLQAINLQGFSGTLRKCSVCHSSNPTGSGPHGITSGIMINAGEVPNSYNMSQNYPNPFNPETIIKFDIPKSSFVTLRVYNELGKEVALLVSETLKPGSYKYEFISEGLASGVYFAKLSADGNIITKRMVLVR
ncbi:MAG: T9SS type A sorting domain-containing protein [Candidatus Kapaibacterium sp.]